MDFAHSPSPSAKAPLNASPRIAGLDTIRLWCALFVVFFHDTSPPLFHGLSRQTGLGRIVLGLYDAAFNGQAAVITFFVISGFCIHLPYASGRPFAAGPFLLGRAARILIPTGAYLLLLQLWHHLEPHFTLLLWSIWCEIAYYFLYPLLRRAFARTSLRMVLGGAYLAAAIATACCAFGPGWHSLFDAGLWTAVAGLPCWLLGCLLAERLPRLLAQPGVSRTRLWLYRGSAWALAYASYLGMFHLHLSFLVSLQAFAIFAYFWLALEIRYYREHPASRTLEWLGGLTFSIYLIHQPAKALLASWTLHSAWLWWALEIGFILAAAALFYTLVEAPSHRLARSFSRRRKTASTLAAAPEIGSAT